MKFAWVFKKKENVINNNNNNINIYIYTHISMGKKMKGPLCFTRSFHSPVFGFLPHIMSNKKQN